MNHRFVHRDWQCVCLSVFECHFRSRCPLAAATHCELKFHILSWKAPWHSSSAHLHCSSEPAPWTCGVRRWSLGQFPPSPAAVRSRCRRASDPTGRLRSSPSSRFLYQDQAWLFVFCTSENTLGACFLSMVLWPWSVTRKAEVLQRTTSGSFGDSYHMIGGPCHCLLHP